MTDLDKLMDHMKEEGYMKKQDLDGILNATKDITIKQILDHKSCGVSGCEVCSMKNNIDGSAYKRGAIDGIKIKTKHPNLGVIE